MALRTLMAALLLSALMAAQQGPAPRSDDPPEEKVEQESESSSRKTRIQDLGGETAPPPPDDVYELRPYNPHKAAKAVEVGEFYFKRKNYKAALSRFEEALEFKPDDPAATYRLAETHERMGNLPEAYKNYRRFLELKRESEFTPLAQAGVERLESQVSVSREEINRDLAEKALSDGEKALARKTYPIALERLREAVRLAPAHARATYRLAEALERVGEFAQASQSYQRYLTMAPDGEFASEARRNMERLKPQLESRGSDEARATSPSERTPQ